jgi:hypothetical protein
VLLQYKNLSLTTLTWTFGPATKLILTLLCGVNKIVLTCSPTKCVALVPSDVDVVTDDSKLSLPLILQTWQMVDDTGVVGADLH